MPPDNTAKADVLTSTSRAASLWACSCIALCYCDRVNMSVAIVEMGKELGWSMELRGQVMSAFFYGYILSQIPGGWVGRKLGYKRVLTMAATGWAILTLLTVPAAAMSFRTLLFCRFTLGLVEGATYPCVFGYLEPFLNPSERSLGIATMLSGNPLGTTIAFLVCPMITVRVGWRGVFVFFAGIGALWVAVWHVFAPSHDTLKRIDKPDESSDEAVDADFRKQNRVVATLKSKDGTDLGLLFRIITTPPCVVIAMCNFCLGFGQYTLLAWLPTYFNERWDIAGDSLTMTMLPYLCMSAASLLSGPLADRLIIDYKLPVLDARKAVNTVAFGIAGFAMIMVPYAGSAFVAVSWVCLALASGVVTNGGGFEANKFDICGENSVSLLQGFANTVGNMSAPIAVTLTAWVVENTGKWASVFWVVAGLYGSAMLAFFIVADSRRRFN